MKKYLYHILVYTLLLLINPLNINGQVKDIIQTQDEIENYNSQHLPEKLYAHTDKSVYLSNDICWFKIYSLEGFFHQPLNLSKVAYVELLDANNQPVIQEKIGLKNGSGNGSFQFPANLPSGKYTMVAYTNWMKNSDPSYFFIKQITIYNTSATPEQASTNIQLNYQVSLFPESGNLITDISNLIGFSVKNQYGQGLNSKGWIINNKGDTISQLTTLLNGLGSFTFTPKNNETYKTVFETTSGNIEQLMPNASSNGYQLHIEETLNDSVSIKVNSNIQNGSSVYLIIHCRGIIKKAIQISLSKGLMDINVPTIDMGEGINTFTLFDAAKNPVAERLLFHYPKMEDGKISIEVNKTNKRQKVNLTLSSTANSPYDASISVYKIDELQTIDQFNIQNYILLSADLVGQIENPYSYFDIQQPNRFKAMDNLMLTQGWRRFSMQDVRDSKNKTFSYLPELGGTIIKGKIINKETQGPSKETTAYISVPSKNTIFKPAISDLKGDIKFEFQDFSNNGQIIFQFDSTNKIKNKIDIDNPFMGKKLMLAKYPPINITSIPKNSMSSQYKNLQIKNYFTPQFATQFDINQQDTTAFYYTPDRTYFLDNYARFNTLEEVIREFVTPVSLVKEKDKFQFYVYDEAYKRFFNQNPLVLLDGVVIKDIDKFLEYDPLKIRKLEIVSRIYYYGNSSFNGVINFITYTGKLDAFELDPNAIVLDYKGLQSKRVFNAPVYETGMQQESRLPDFRELLYWNPNMIIHKKNSVSFYTSDVPGNYIISVQGVNKEGTLFNQSIPFFVK
jgi:hypothetical protein